MWFRKKDRSRLRKIEEALIVLGQAVVHRDNLIVEQRGLIDKLMKDNNTLLDRMMSQNFESFKTFTYPEQVDESNYDFMQDESLAGEVYDGEENRRPDSTNK